MFCFFTSARLARNVFISKLCTFFCSAVLLATLSNSRPNIIMLCANRFSTTDLVFTSVLLSPLTTFSSIGLYNTFNIFISPPVSSSIVSMASLVGRHSGSSSSRTNVGLLVPGIYT